MWESLKHAFAVTPDAPPDPAELEVAEALAAGVVKRELATPALMFLEMSRPMNYIGAQALNFFMPIATVLFNRQQYETLTRFLERRDAIDILCQRIEALDQAARGGANS